MLRAHYSMNRSLTFLCFFYTVSFFYIFWTPDFRITIYSIRFYSQSVSETSNVWFTANYFCPGINSGYKSKYSKLCLKRNFIGTEKTFRCREYSALLKVHNTWHETFSTLHWFQSCTESALERFCSIVRLHNTHEFRLSHWVLIRLVLIVIQF